MTNVAALSLVSTAAIVHKPKAINKPRRPDIKASESANIANSISRLANCPP